MNLIFSCQTAYLMGAIDHPQRVMQQLGIEYQIATPQSMGDAWWFWSCTKVPDPLPGYLSELVVKPSEAVGFGLSAAGARLLEGGG